MTAPELIARLEEAGACVLVTGGKPTLRLAPGETLSTDERIDLHLHRAAVVEHFSERRDVAITCKECKRGIFTPEPADVWACCGNVACPWWREGMEPQWVGRARSYLLWKREQKIQEQQGIPE